MDELEISGKRYISTRRAGKEHKYHSDYIGQLIRAGKVDGQKVGRSWYVAEDSLAEYLGKEAAPKAPVMKVEVPAKVMKVHKVAARPVIEEEVEEGQTSNVAVMEGEVETAEVFENDAEEDKNYIPVKIGGNATKREASYEIKKQPVAIKKNRGGLRYIADDGPLYPRVETTPIEREVPSRMPVRTNPAVVYEEQTYLEQQPVTLIERPRVRKNNRIFIMRGGMVAAVALVTLGVVAAASAMIVSTTTVQGESASISYSLSGI